MTIRENTEIERLEARVRDRLLDLTAGLPGQSAASAGNYGGDYRGRMEERVVRGGLFRRNPLRIHAPQRLVRSRQYGQTPDGLAHRLTRLPVEPARALAGRVRDILLLPELVEHADCLLTHVFVPDRNLLAIYLYPERLEQAALLASPERFRGAAEPGPGLLAALCRSLDAYPESRPRDAGATAPDRILKFLIAGDHLLPGEIEAMREIHDRYRKFRVD